VGIVVKAYSETANIPGGLFQLLDQLSVQPKAFRLGRDVTSRSKGVVKKLEVRLFEEGSSGSDRIRRVGDNDIIGRGVLLQELETISDMHGDLWVGECLGHVREVLFGDTDHGLPTESELTGSRKY
jgi:hypothetical protein